TDPSSGLGRDGGVAERPFQLGCLEGGLLLDERDSDDLARPDAMSDRLDQHRSGSLASSQIRQDDCSRPNKTASPAKTRSPPPGSTPASLSTTAPGATWPMARLCQATATRSTGAAMPRCVASPTRPSAND